MKNLLKKKNTLSGLIIALCGLLFVALAPLPVLADECEHPAVHIEVPFGSVNTVYGLTNYIAELYQFIVGAVGIIAAVMIMFNGLRWAAAAGNSEQISEAKSGISGAFIGLFLALTSYLILANINGSLVGLPDICPEGIEFTASLSTSGWESCPNGTVTECSGFDYCKFDGGCECANIGTAEKDFVCRPIGTDVLPANMRCKQDSNCSGHASGTLECVGANAIGTSPGNCIQKQANQTCTVDADCTAPYTCQDSNVSGSKQCLTDTGRGNYTTCDTDAHCESGACNESKGICSPGNGSEEVTTAPCDENSDCLEGYACNPSTTLCRPKVEGDPCPEAFNAACGSGLFCIEEYDTGEYCTNGDEMYLGDTDDPDLCGSNDDCASGYFCVDTWGDDECYDGSTGDPCDTGSQCQSGTCTSDECT